MNDGPVRQATLNAPQSSGLYRADSMTVSMGASAAATFLSRFLGFVRNVVLAWLLPQSQYGLLGLAQLLMNVLQPLCGAGLYEGVTRYAPMHESAGTLHRFAFRTSVLLVCLSVGIGGALWVLAGPLGTLLFSAAGATSTTDVLSASGSLTGLMRATVFGVVAASMFLTLLGMLKGLRMFRAHGVGEVTVVLVFSLLAVGVVLAGFKSAGAVIVTYGIACVVALVLVGAGLRTRLSKTVGSTTEGNDHEAALRSSPPASLMTYSLWAAATAVTWHAMSYYPMWYLLKVSDGETVGTFHAVRTITQMMQVAGVMLTGVVSANVTRMWEHDGREVAIPRLQLLTKLSLLVLLGGATILSLAQPIVLRLFPSTFAGGASAYDPLVLFFLLVGVVSLVAVRLNLVEKPRLVCLAWCVGVVVNVATSYLLLEPQAAAGVTLGLHPLAAAAWAGVAGVAAALVVCVALTYREGVGFGPSTLLLVAGCFAAAGGAWVVLTATALLCIVAATTNVFLTADERVQVTDHFHSIMRR